MRHNDTSKVDQLTVLRLAAEAEVDPRTARKAILHGLEAIKPLTAARLAEAMKKLGLLPVEAA